MSIISISLQRLRFRDTNEFFFKGTKGFQAVGGKSAKGQALLKKVSYYLHRSNENDQRVSAYYCSRSCF